MDYRKPVLWKRHRHFETDLDKWTGRDNDLKIHSMRPRLGKKIENRTHG